MDSAPYKVKLDIFEGPLDLLLYLIKKDEIDIHSISIERITTQYLEYIQTFKLLNIDLTSEFIVMAANLMYLKSRALLPQEERPPEEEIDEADPKWELVRQLIEYKKFKDAASFLSQRELDQEGYFAHVSDTELVPEAPFAPIYQSSVFDLIQAFQSVLSRFENKNDLGSIIDEKFTVSDKIAFILETMPVGEKFSFTKLFSFATTKPEIITIFLAVLELIKMNQLAVFQDHLLGEIEILRK